MSDIQLVGLEAKDLDSLHEKTVKELQELAKKNGIKSVTGIRKQTLIDRIRSNGYRTVSNCSLVR